ncbi:MAG: hypothetical protein LBM61_01115 [Prevotellaceae bacterium]|jgi:hypothetical protein|nr:hypothetical protein [Prevotellaceae bacterium]
MTIAYSFGIIDFLNFGHMRLFQESKACADKYIFGLIADSAVLSWYGTLVSSYEERFSVLSGVRYIDELVYQKTFDPLLNLQKIHQQYPEAKIILCIGTDRNFVSTEIFLHSIGGEIRYFDYYEKLSPQNIYNSLTQKLQRNRNYTFSNLISTKANTLDALSQYLTKARIEELYIITVSEVSENIRTITQYVSDKFHGEKVVVRSSSLLEDCYETSNAGHFDSVLNVNADSPEEVQAAIQKVIQSYDAKSEHYLNEQVLIQRQTTDVICSGVLFTRDLDSNLPYYLINYDDGQHTDSVTSGSGGTTVWILRSTAKQNPPEKWAKLLAAVRELEHLLNKMILDIEFAITTDNQVVLFQVRPLASNYKLQVKRNNIVFNEIYQQEILSYKKIHNYLTSEQMIFSDMAFWNPAEIIGVNPHNLDYSLYREIITKSAWNEGLLPLGYEKVSDDLMFKVGNKPYISIDYSFMALIPATIQGKLRDKILQFYKHKLSIDPSAHDKIEFEIIYSCFDFCTEQYKQELQAAGFSKIEVKTFIDSLYVLTNTVINEYATWLSRDMDDIRQLESIRQTIEEDLATNRCTIYAKLYYIGDLLSAIKTYGTPQFSRQARCAFISQSLCKSMVSTGVIEEETMDQFMSSIHTVASQFEEDFINLSMGTLSLEEFNRLYGHLRCGTYNIQSPRYDETTFCLNGAAGIRLPKKELPSLAIQRIEQALSTLRFDAPVEQIIDFIKTSLEQREFVKFEFTKSLSLTLSLIKRIGGDLGIPSTDLSFLDIADIQSATNYSSIEELTDFWKILISERKKIFDLKSMLILPNIIFSEKDLEIIEMDEARPNFITTKKVVAETICLDNNNIQEIRNKIVVISKADPGYDWIFAQGIAGLVTKYGGAASHMAIRCAEFALPAAIGCGEKIYNYITKSNYIELDCANQQITRTLG